MQLNIGANGASVAVSQYTCWAASSLYDDIEHIYIYNLYMAICFYYLVFIHLMRRWQFGAELPPVNGNSYHELLIFLSFFFASKRHFGMPSSHLLNIQIPRRSNCCAPCAAPSEQLRYIISNVHRPDRHTHTRLLRLWHELLTWIRQTTHKATFWFDAFRDSLHRNT